MYRLSLVLFLAMLSGCGVTRVTYVPSETTFRAIDFTEFAERGFLFTTEMFQGQYEGRGILELTMRSEGIVPLDQRGFNNWIFAEAKVADGLREMVVKAQAMGADAVVNLRITRGVTDYLNVYVPLLSITGFAIKRIK